MSKPRFQPKDSKCSRFECPNDALTRIFHDGRWHKVCKSCWLTFEDGKDRAAVEAAANPPADRKTLAAGGS